MKKNRTNPQTDDPKDKHSIPRVFVQVKDIGYCVPGIEIFCGNPKHEECRAELAAAIKDGGVIVPRHYWVENRERVLSYE